MNTATLKPARRDIRVISLVGLAHGLSHFYALAFPMLFVFMKDDLGLSFTELGLLTTVFYATSGFCQTAAGFATDRFGGPRMLFAGVGLFALSYLVMGMAPNYATLMACAVVSGLGNSVFHPADFAILNSTVDPKRLGYAFSAHGFTGNVGFMMAPVVMGPLALMFGWHGALTVVGFVAVLALLLLVLQREFLAPVEREEAAATAAPDAGAMVIFSTPVLMCFGFFILLAAGIVGMQSWGPLILTSAHHLSRDAALAAVSAFLAGGTAGIAAGGWAAGRTERHDMVAGGGMAGSCLMVLLVATNVLPVPGIAAALALAGFLSGIAQPSRDMVIRKTAPKGSTGKVYGFVYSGLDAGSASAPLLFAYLLGHNLGNSALYFVALFWGLAMFTIVTVRRAPDGAPRAA